MVFLDAIHYHVCSESQIVKKSVYIAIAIDLDGRKDVLGMWVGENESAKFWATVLNGLKNRGVEDILIACTDNLTGFDAAIHATFPQTEIQNCIIHQLRNSSKYVSYEGFNRHLRKVTKAKSVFPTDDSLLKMLYSAFSVLEIYTHRLYFVDNGAAVNAMLSLRTLSLESADHLSSFGRVARHSATASFTGRYPSLKLIGHGGRCAATLSGNRSI